MFARSYSGTSLTLRNCVLLGSSGDTRTLLSGFSSADFITMDHNAYSTSVDKVALSYTSGSGTSDQSLSQWQALGFDANSFNTSQAHLVAHIPQSGSSLVNAGANLTPPIATDYSGATFAVRKTVGAYEPTFVVITTQPVDQTLLVGQTATFFVQTSTTVNITYQWKKNGVNIPGATAATYTIPSVSASDIGSYTVTISDSSSSATSNAAGLLPLSAQPSATQIIAAGQAISFSISPAGAGPFTYQWMKNGINIVGATGASYSIAHVSQSDYAQYSVAVTSNSVTYTAGPYSLTTNPPPDTPTLPPWALILLAILLIFVAGGSVAIRADRSWKFGSR